MVGEGDCISADGQGGCTRYAGCVACGNSGCVPRAREARTHPLHGGPVCRQAGDGLLLAGPTLILEPKKNEEQIVKSET